MAKYKRQCEVWKLNYDVAEANYFAELNKRTEESILKDRTIFGSSVAVSLIVGILIGTNLKH